MEATDWIALGDDAAQEDITAMRHERDDGLRAALRCTTIEEARRRIVAWLAYVPAEPGDLEASAQSYLATWLVSESGR